MWRKWGNFQEYISCKLLGHFLLNLIEELHMYMESVKYMNLVNIDIVVIEIQGVKNGELEVLVNSIRTYSSHGFLGADTRLCVLMLMIQYLCLLCHYDIY